MIAIHPGDDAEGHVWATALEVSRLFADVPWVLVGAQMVILLEREAGRSSGRTTGDVDVVVDVRGLGGGTRHAAERLVAAGFGLGSAQHPYRFVRGVAQVDLLAPDHIGARIDLTTIPPSTTTEIPGGSRALASRRVVGVDVVGVGSGSLPVPSLAAAIVLKVRAWHARHGERDAGDLVRLLSLVADVDVVRRELKPAERRALARVTPLGEEAHRVWRSIDEPQEAQAAFARLSR